MTRRWVPALLLAASLATPGHAAGKCTAVTTSGRFTTIMLPTTLTTTPFDVVPAASRSQRDTLVASTGRAMMRSTDGGCTWQKGFSLDSDTPDTWWGKHTTTTLVSDIAVSQNRTGPRTVYAVGRDSTSLATVSLPFFTLVSHDAGAHWQFHEPPLTVEGLDQRCANVYLTAGADPRVAHLSCAAAGLAEFGLTAALQCSQVQLVTGDSGATWRLVTPRWSAARTDCSQAWTPAADVVTPHVLWNLPGCEVSRSVDDGKTFATYAKVPSGGCSYGYVMALGSDRDGRSIGVLCGGGIGIWLIQSGKLVRTAPIPLRSHELGMVRGCAVDRAAGRIVMFYVDGNHQARVYTYDLARRTWRLVGMVPFKKGDYNGWDEFGMVDGWVSPNIGYVYTRKSFYADRIVRITL